jgi:hypothetical protein
MVPMSVVFLLCAITVVVSQAPLTASKPAHRARELDKYARRMGVAVPAEIEQRVTARLLRRERLLTIGGLVGIAAATGVALLLPAGFDAPYVGVLLFAGAGVGGSAAAALASSTSELSPITGPRVARSTVPAHADYVPTLERLGSRLLPPLALLTLVAAAVALNVGALGEARLTPAYLWSSVGAWLAYAAVAALVFAELLAGRILRTGQQATNTTNLAWNDALRSQALRDLSTAPIVFGFSSIVVIFFDVGSLSDYQGAGALAAVVGLVLLVLIATAGCALLVVDLVSKPQQHYWRRLWAGRAAGAPA